jgi:hypothetical protein
MLPELGFPLKNIILWHNRGFFAVCALMVKPSPTFNKTKALDKVPLKISLESGVDEL